MDQMKTVNTMHGGKGYLPGVLFSGPPPGHTASMKTAVSLPDELFQAAERHARRSRKSRSRLYAEAIAEYLARHAPDEVTAAMDRVVDRLGETERDDFVSRAAQRTLERAVSMQWLPGKGSGGEEVQ